MAVVLFFAAAGKKRVLIVDDEPDMLMLMRLLVEEAFPGLEVITAATPDAALDFLSHGAVDVVISDYRMPRMDGLELLQRAIAGAPDCSAILVTAFSDDALREKALAVGVHSFIEKGTSPHHLVNALERALGEAL